jgi:hypothetical protein
MSRGDPRVRIRESIEDLQALLDAFRQQPTHSHKATALIGAVLRAHVEAREALFPAEAKPLALRGDGGVFHAYPESQVPEGIAEACGRPRPAGKVEAWEDGPPGHLGASRRASDGSLGSSVAQTTRGPNSNVPKAAFASASSGYYQDGQSEPCPQHRQQGEAA